MDGESLASTWSENKLALISAAIAAIEVTVLFIVAFSLGGTLLSHSTGLSRLVAADWLFGGPVSIGFALAGIFLDSRKRLAVLALIFACACWAFCTLQMLV
jgi:hypothetical protein